MSKTPTRETLIEWIKCVHDLGLSLIGNDRVWVRRDGFNVILSSEAVRILTEESHA